jgi:hypothetical protein
VPSEPGMKSAAGSISPAPSAANELEGAKAATESARLDANARPSFRRIKRGTINDVPFSGTSVEIYASIRSPNLLSGRTLQVAALMQG